MTERWPLMRRGKRGEKKGGEQAGVLHFEEESAAMRLDL